MLMIAEWRPLGNECELYSPNIDYAQSLIKVSMGQGIRTHSQLVEIIEPIFSLTKSMGPNIDFCQSLTKASRGRGVRLSDCFSQKPLQPHHLS